jgi:O-acetyl-ADP-ribose deacetylase (regulator of RNase III)
MPASPLRPFERTINRSTLRLYYCDITTLDVDVLVSSDDVDLSMGGGVSRALRVAGGESVRREASARAPIPLGGVAVTTAGRLAAKRVFHAAVLNYASMESTTLDLVTSVTGTCLKLCDEMGFRSIAFPVLATGAARLAREESAVAMLVEIGSHLRSGTSLESVVVALYPRPPTAWRPASLLQPRRGAG